MAQQSPSRFLVGIDLGTVNSALAWIDLAAEGDPVDSLSVMPVLQLVAPGEVAERPLLPSSAYLPGAHELPPGATRLPWAQPGEPTAVVGELARVQGARVPGRLISSAKSWLSHAGVDRTAAILPWGAPEEVPRLSPVDASALYLSHLRQAWALRHPDAPLETQEVVLTVPASFDEVARELTVRAARVAGLERISLLEEPQAAFYDFVARHRAALPEALGGTPATILVCDVGGGTTDFTLIAAELRDGAPALRRIAVGDHLLLGGDNVDLALARSAEARLGARLDAVQWSLLVQASRAAKERLLAPSAPDRVTVSIPGRGSRLLEGALSAELTREEVRELVLEGFFPHVGPDDLPRRSGRSGLLELGLPYQSEPAITRHALAFLRDHAAEAAEASGRPASPLPRPDALLLNGGVFTPAAVRERIQEVLSSWFPGAPPIRLLGVDRLDVAVARGAAYSGLVRRGLGLRIGGGTARAYFVAVEAGEREDREDRIRALCLVPRHLEEGAEVEIPRTFALRVERPVRFQLYATSRARFERPGDLATLSSESSESSESFTALPPIETVLRTGAGQGELPVRLRARLSEIGTLELWCAAEQGDARWKLEFELRGGERSVEREASELPAMPRRFAEARGLVEVTFGKKPAPVERRDVRGLTRALEKVLGPREGWTTPVLRDLWAALHAGLARRRRSAEHERIWCSLTGYCLRPGFGAPLDGWRAAQTFAIFGEGLQFQADPRAWQTWWVLWRRIAGGLEADAQARIFDAVAPLLRPMDPRRPRAKTPGVKPEALDEVVRLAGSLERVAVGRKREAGEAILSRVESEGPLPHLLWALGRLGARVPFYGSGHACIPPGVAEAWIDRLLALPAGGDRVFALVQLARLSGDRARDVDPEVRARVLRTLASAAPDEVLRPVREVVELGAAEEGRIFGEALPAGLRLLR
jgi:molecular chaperone DnaK (HSP70)